MAENRIDPRMVARIATKWGLDPRIFVNQIRQESGFNPNAVSHAGAQGIAQIVPKYHPDAPPMSQPINQLNWAAKYMRDRVKQYGNYADALSVYNSGRPWERGQNIAETKNYVETIMGRVKGNPTFLSELDGSKQSQDFQGLEFQNPLMQNTIQPSQSNLASLLSFAYQNNAYFAETGKANPYSGMGLLNMLNQQQQSNPEYSYQPLATNNPVGLMGNGKQGLAGAVAGGKLPNPSNKGWNQLSGIAGNTPQFMLQAIKKAQSMGLRVGENPYTDPIDGNHVSGSFHYQTFPGKYGGKSLGKAIDVSGDSEAMKNFFRWAIRYRPAELFHDPLGQYDTGRYSPRGIGGHGQHVHLAAA